MKSRPQSAVRIALVVLSAAAATAFAHQLINPSFEDPGGKGELWISDRASRWERWGAWFNRETTWTPVHDGQCIMAYHHWKIQGDETAGIYQDIPNVKPDQTYTFSVEAIRDKFTNAEYVEVRLEPFLGGETLASQVYRMNDMKSGKWTTLEVSGSPKTAGIRVLVIVKPGRRSRRKGALKFDSTSLKTADPSRTDGVDNPAYNHMYGTIRRRRR